MQTHIEDPRRQRRVATTVSTFLAVVIGASWLGAQPRGEFRDVRPLVGENLNFTGAREGTLALSEDELSLVFSPVGTQRPQGPGGEHDLWMAARSNRDASFGPAVLAGINTPEDDATPYLSRDGRTLIFSSSGRPGVEENFGAYDLYVATRPEAIRDGQPVPFDEVRNLGALVNTFAIETSAAVSPDGRWLYFGRERAPGDGKDIWVAPWDEGSPEVADEAIRVCGNVNGSFDNFFPWLTPDGSGIALNEFLGPYRNLRGDSDLWFATLSWEDDCPKILDPTNAGPFRLVNTQGFELGAWFSYDWPGESSKLYFTRFQDGSTLLYEATWYPEPPRNEFRRGDANVDGATDIADPVYVLNHLFGGGSAPSCMQTADTNDDNTVDIADPVYQLNHLFGGGLPISAPVGECGTDPTPAANVEDDLSCEAYPPCEI